jgi:hypothetical protein
LIDAAAGRGCYVAGTVVFRAAKWEKDKNGRETSKNHGESVRLTYDHDKRRPFQIRERPDQGLLPTEMVSVSAPGKRPPWLPALSSMCLRLGKASIASSGQRTR